MSAATLYESSWHAPSRREPYQLPAGIMALAVHGLLFALLYFGFSWHSKPIEMINVELWQNLPETLDVPQEKPTVEEVVQPPPQPAEVVQPDIELPEDKKPVPAPVKTVEPKSEKKPVKKQAAAKADAKKSVGQQQVDEDIDQELLLAEQQAERERAEEAAARGRVVNEYKARIQNKITRNIVMPPGVRDDALAVFRVTLLPGGGVLSVVMKKSSGNAAYDNAVERAVYKSDPLPLPPDAAMFKEFRILELKFQPR
jgi:colicin import membrane protein